ncbi:MAG: amino acid decarboxylase, partial [Gemmatimonadota bacterium]
MIERIRSLERVARRLEPDAGERARVRDAVVEYSEEFLERIDDLKAYVADKSAVEELRDAPVREEGRELDELLSL